MCYVVINRKTTKFESNSQHTINKQLILEGCYQSQNYKIWKQFTTIQASLLSTIWLLSIAKLQNLKAIHNKAIMVALPTAVVINRKTTKFESNSQQDLVPYHCTHRCYQSQNYKIWKQFTTGTSTSNRPTVLLSIAKLQNLKAIHNSPLSRLKNHLVVINRKTTKFESNSQHLDLTLANGDSCYQSQNYKIWKQFTTDPCAGIGVYMLLSIAKLQNLKAIHN